MTPQLILNSRRMFFYTGLIAVLFLFSGISVHGQRPRQNVMTHKYSKGDRYRISVSQYRTFAVTGESMNRSSFGETTYDLYMQCLASDGDVMDAQIHAEITKIAKDGQNLTYRLGQSLKQPPWLFAFDKFGRVLPESVNPLEENNAAPDTSWIRDFSLFLVPLPDYPLKVGDKWDILNADLAKRFQGTFGDAIHITKTNMKGHYRLESIDDGVAMITLDVELSGSGRVRESERAVMELDLLIHMMGSYFHHIASGKLVNGQLTSELAAIGTHAGKEVNFSGTHTISFNNEKSK